MITINRLNVIVLFLLFISQTAKPQTSSERHQRIRAASDAGDIKQALSELRGLREANSALFAVNNYDYLQARLSEKDGDQSQANAAYESVVARKSLLSQYALWHLGQSARSIGDLVLERERLRHLLASTPASLLREAALLRLGESFFESGDYDNAISTLEQLNTAKNVATMRRAAVLMGQSYSLAGKQLEARTVFTKVVMQMPDASRPDDFALAAVRELDGLDASEAKAKGTTSSPISEAEHLLRAAIYQFNRDFSGARAHYLAIIEQFPQSSSVANALYQTGRGFYLEAKYEDALKFFQRVLKEFPDSTNTRDALSSTAATYNRLGRFNEAIETYRRLASRFPERENPERAFLNIIDLLHEAGRHTEALSWVQETRTQFKGQIGEALALFAQLRIHLAQGNWQVVITDADEIIRLPDLGDTRVPGGTSKSEVTFLRAYANELLGKDEEAISLYLSIPDGRNEYYGGRATQRLLSLAVAPKTSSAIASHLRELQAESKKALASGQNEQARSSAQLALRLTESPPAIGDLRKILMTTYESLPAYNFPRFSLYRFGRQQVVATGDQSGSQQATNQLIADELFFLGLYDEALPEFITARSMAQTTEQTGKGAQVEKQRNGGSSGLTDTDYSIATYSLRGGLVNRAVRFAEMVWKSIPGDYVIDLAPTDLVELLFPVPFRQSLLQHAAPRNVDPRFLLAIARQESRFQTDAKSVAAARGMMQFIPATANDIAKNLGRRTLNQDELYNPDTAILFGAQYLADLFQRFPGQPQAVASAYNGGPDNTARWIARSRSSEADRYVPEIGFSQTKDYVWKVMKNLWLYKQLYDSELRSKTTESGSR